MESHRNSKNNQFYARLTPEELAALKQCAVEGSAKAQPTSIAVSAAMMLAIKFGYIKTHGPLQSSIYVVFSGMMTYFTSRLVYGASCINNLPPIKAKFQGRFNAVNEQQQKQGPRISPDTEDKTPAVQQRPDGISFDIQASDFTFTQNPSQNSDDARPEQSARQFTNTYETLREQNRRLYEENAKKNDSYKPLASGTFWESSRRSDEDYNHRAEDYGSFQQHYKD